MPDDWHVLCILVLQVVQLNGNLIYEQYFKPLMSYLTN